MPKDKRIAPTDAVTPHPKLSVSTAAKIAANTNSFERILIDK